MVFCLACVHSGLEKISYGILSIVIDQNVMYNDVKVCKKGGILMKRERTGLRLFLSLLLAAAIILNHIPLKLDAQECSKNILILNSYHKGLSWTDRQVEGITGVLEEVYEYCNIAVEYMDWKNYPTERNLSELYDSLKYKYADKKLDVVIATDDAALEFALKHRAEIFSDAPIVFSGVNEQGIGRLTKDHSNVTGIAEIIDPEKTVRAAMEIYPDLEEIYVLFDNTESGLSTGEMTIEAIRKVDSDIMIHRMNQKSINEILDEVAKASDKSIVLLTTYYMDPKGGAVGFENITRMVSKSSRVPVFHLYAFGIDHGAFGGSMLSGRLQGEGAGKIASRILKGEDISNIPVELTKTTRYIFDYDQLDRFGIPMNKVPKDSEVVKRPYSFFEEYRSIVLTIELIFALLIGFIIILVFYIKKIRRMRNELEKNHHELKASESMLKEQYQQLVKAQQSLISSESRYSLLFEKMLNGFAIFEPVKNEGGKIVDLRFININPGFKTQVGVNVNQIVGRTWMEVFGYPNQNLRIYHNILETGQSMHFETYYSATGIYYLANAFKISNSQIGVVFDNITIYKRVIKEISTLNEELEQRVAERTQELQNAVNELEAFTYTVSHDLKSPIRAVDGYSRIVLEDFASRLGEEGVEIMGNIRGICKDMIELISKLLSYSTMAKAEIVKEEVDVEGQVRSIFNELQSANRNRNIKLSVETGLPMVSADRVLMRQVLHNLLSNAVKFTRHKEEALISVGCTITEEEYIFYVKDNGAGFDMDYSDKLFGIFQRLHTVDEFEGSGIGLVTVKKIIQKHGGRVWIEGRPGAGASVYFALPLKKQDE